MAKRVNKYPQSVPANGLGANEELRERVLVAQKLGVDRTILYRRRNLTQTVRDILMPRISRRPSQSALISCDNLRRFDSCGFWRNRGGPHYRG